MTLKLPLSIILPRKKKDDKKFYVNLNTYRNAHFHILSDAKNVYREAVRVALGDRNKIDSLPPYQFTYTIHPQSRRRFDNSNICSIIDKFTCDALVDLGLLKDDSTEFISRTVYNPPGELRRDDPHCVLEIVSTGGNHHD